MTLTLGDVGAVQSGLSLRGSLSVVQEGMPAIQLGDITADGAIETAKLARIDFEAALRRHVVGPGDIVFKSRGTNTVACAVGEWLSEPAVAIMPMFIIRPMAELVDPGYLAWFLNQPAAQRHLAQGAAGTSLRMIGKTVLQATPVELPALDAQRSIASLSALAARERRLSALLAERKFELLTQRLALLARSSSTSTGTGTGQ